MKKFFDVILLGFGGILVFKALISPRRLI